MDLKVNSDGFQSQIHWILYQTQARLRVKKGATGWPLEPH